MRYFTARPNYLLWPTLLLALTGCEMMRNFQISKIGAEYYQAEVDGFVESDKKSNGTRIDLEDTIDFGKERDFVYRGSMSITDVAFDFRYFDFGYSENGTLSEATTLGNETFMSGDDVTGKLDIELIDIRSKFPVTALGPVTISGIIGVEILDAEIEIASSSKKASESFDQWFPTAGLGAEFKIPFSEDFAFFIDGNAAVLGWDFLDVRGFYLDAAARVGIQASILNLGVGYRRTDFDLEDRSSDMELDFVMQGPFIFGELAF